MQKRPDPPAEGRLIAEATTRQRLSIGEAARRAGISYGRWRQITTGVQNVSPGEFAVVRAPARTLATMARVVGVTPEEMEKAGRPDAAEEMRREQPAEPPSGPRRLPTLEALRDPGTEPYRHIVDMERDAGIPPRNESEARIFASARLSEDQKREFVADMRWAMDGAPPASQQGTG